MLISRPDPVSIGIATGAETRQNLSLSTFLHLNAKAQANVRAAGENPDSNTEAVHEQLRVLLTERLNVPPDWFTEDMVCLIVGEFTRLYDETKKKCVCLDASQSS